MKNTKAAARFLLFRENCFTSAAVSKHFAIFGEIEKSPVIIRSSAIYCSDLMTMAS